MTMTSETTIYLGVGDPPTVSVGHPLAMPEDSERGWLSITDADSTRSEVTIHFDDPQQVVDFAAALIEAVYPEHVIGVGVGELIDLTGKVVARVAHAPDLSDAGTDRLLADLRDGE